MISNNKFQFSLVSTIFSLAGPTMLEQLMQTAVQYIDTAMVGTLGTDATAAVGSTTTVNWLVGSTISAISVGFLAYISQADGAGKKDDVKKASSQAVLAVLVLGVLFTILTLSLSSFVPLLMQVDENIRDLASRYFFIIYIPMLARTASIIFGTILRSVGDTRTPMRVGVAVNIINVVLNYILIYPTHTIEILSLHITVPGAGMGVIGAAAASAVAFASGGICMTIAVWRHPSLSPKGQYLKPDLDILKPCLKVAFPNALQRFASSFGYVCFAAMINSLGEISTAAHTIANTVESAFYIPGYGMQTAAATLAGNAFGANDREKIENLSKVILTIEVLLMIISGSLLFVFAPDMVRIFSKDENVITLGSTVLRMVAVSEPFYGFSIIVEGMMQGMGRTIMPFICNISCMWGIRIIGTFICTQLLSHGLISAWACMILHNLTLFVLFLIYYLTGRWNPLNKNR